MNNSPFDLDPETGFDKPQDTDPLETSEATGYKPWRYVADECPWKEFRSGTLYCNGNIDKDVFYAPCCGAECALYHFTKGL